MGDNILGLLLITSSSRGRNVFRYPPDPLSPLARLSQPIYPVSLFTADYIGSASEPAARGELQRNRSGIGRWGDDPASSGFTSRSKKSNGSLAPPYEDDSRKPSPSVKSPMSDMKEKSRQMQKLVELELGRRSKEQGEGSDTDSQISDEEDPEDMDNWMAAGNPRLSRTERGMDLMPSTSVTNGLAKDDGTVTFSTNGANTRRSSSTQRRRFSRTRESKNGSDDKSTDTYDENLYHNSLGYSLDFLSDMLTPSRTACNRKFEICVDELVFVGHPVSCGPDGRWAYPAHDEDDADVRATARGRRPKPHGPSHLGTVVEHAESSPDGSVKAASRDESPQDRQTSTSRPRTDVSDDAPPELNMFHLVIILDKPDPHPGASIESVSPMNVFDEVYKEIAFKWTAAAFELQIRDNYIAREAHEMAKIKEKCMNECMPLRACNKLVYDKCSLDRSLNQLYAEIYQLQNRVPNPLYANLPTTITASVSDIPFSITLSPQHVETDEAWAHWGEIDDHDSLSSLSDDEDWNDALVHMPPGGITSKSPDFKVDPWQTLLLLDDKAYERSEEIAQALYGLGLVMSAAGSRQSSVVTSGSDSRRGSKDNSNEGDEGHLMKALIEACDVSRTLSNIAHILRFDLDGIVIPLARELVQNKKAILIDPINARLRTIVMPTTIGEHPTTWEQYADRFHRRFPRLPHLGTFLSSISEHPAHYRSTLPKDLQNQSGNTATDRQMYFDALIWLLKHDLVIQVHTRARIFARAEVKREAWLKLWHRRRARWLASRERRSSQSTNTSSGANSDRDRVKSPGSSGSRSSRPSLSHSMTSDQITPRAIKTLNPLESLATVPGPQQHGPLTLEQSYMDYDPDLEMDSDVGDGDAPQSYDDMTFSEDITEPEDVPVFTSTFIFKPGRAQKEEARWLRVIREQGVSQQGERRDEVWASKFDLCVQYFDGISTFEEIVFRTGLPRRELDHLLELYKADVRLPACELQ